MAYFYARTKVDERIAPDATLLNWLRELSDEHHVFLDALGPDFECKCLLVKPRGIFNIVAISDPISKAETGAKWVTDDGNQIENPLSRLNSLSEKVRDFILQEKDKIFEKTEASFEVKLAKAINILSSVCLTRPFSLSSPTPLVSGRVFFRAADFRASIQAHNWIRVEKGGITLDTGSVKRFAQLLQLELVSLWNAAASVETPPNENPYHFSGAVGPEHFRGRINKIKDAFDCLTARKPTPVALVGLERTGKSSLGTEIVRRLQEEKKMHYMAFEFGDYDPTGEQVDISGFILVKSRGRLPLGRFADQLKPKKKRNTIAIEREIFRTAVKALKSETKRNTVLFIDELNKLEDRTAGAGHNSFIDFLESIARDGELDLRLIVSTRPIVFSINESFRKANPFRLFKVITVASVEPEEAREIVALGKPQLEFESDAVNRVLALAGNNPYWIQLLCHNIFDDLKNEPQKTVSRGIVENSFRGLLANSAAQAYFSSLYRDIEVLPSSMKLLRSIALLAESEETRVSFGQLSPIFESNSEQLEAALQPLENYEILVKHTVGIEQKLCFKSEGLRQFLRIKYNAPSNPV
jgi:hypothetical protein